MSGIKIVINPLSGRLDRVELNGPEDDLEGQKYLFSVYQALVEDIRRFAKTTSSRVQIDRVLGRLEEPSPQLKHGHDLSIDMVKV